MYAMQDARPPNELQANTESSLEDPLGEVALLSFFLVLRSTLIGFLVIDARSSRMRKCWAISVRGRPGLVFPEIVYLDGRAGNPAGIVIPRYVGHLRGLMGRRHAVLDVGRFSTTIPWRGSGRSAQITP